jgi:glycosyltransferase involved in cell wall biosynthesis
MMAISYQGSVLMAQRPVLSVVVPVYNEQDSLAKTIDRLVQVPHLFEIIIVDDCSTDATPQIIDDLRRRYPALVKSLRHERNKGKTAGLNTGFQATSGEIVIVQDADLEYDPSEINGVIGPILDGNADVVYGSRFMVKKAARVLYYYHYLANKLITGLSNVLTNINLSDVETGYKAFRGEIIRNMIITSSGFGFEIEVTAKVSKLKCRMYEVPISYYGRTYEEGKKIGASDGVYALWCIFKYNWFVPLSRSFRKRPDLKAFAPAKTFEASMVDR